MADQTEAISDLAESIRELSRSAAVNRRLSWVLVVLLGLSLAGTFATGLIIVQNNNAALQRSKTSNAQRQQLADAAADQRDINIVTNYCSVSTNSLDTYKACLAGYGIKYPVRIQQR